MKYSRKLFVVAMLVVAATMYSLSELHSISTVHTSAVKRFDLHEEKVADVHLAQKLQEPAAAASVQTITKPTSHKQCFTYEHTELWGDVVVWGNNHLKDSAGACCEACQTHKPPTADDFDCNVWVWCGDKATCGTNYQQCWLKHLAHPEAAKPAKEGPDVSWTAGTVGVDIKANPGVEKNKKVRKYHIVSSAQGMATYWQIRIHYYWYKKQKHLCEAQGQCEMGGFTRLLHSGQADDLMDEVPTMVVDPMPASMVEHSWYIVLNRPYAFVEWVKKQSIPEKYVLMAEPDHVFIKPVPNFMTSESPAAFPFFYIEPGSPKHAKVTQKFTGPLSKRQLDELAPIGNSPTFMTLEDMKKVMPLWLNVSVAIFKDQEANAAWGWVQEMYGFTIALWLSGIKHVDLYLHMMAQPPWDTNMEMAPGKPFPIIHFTYGMDYTKDGVFTPGKFGEWRYDKRTYTSRPMPRHLTDPPAGMKNDLVRTLIASFNEATAAIPCWDQFVKLSHVPATCDEKPGGFLALEAELKAKGQKAA